MNPENDGKQEDLMNNISYNFKPIGLMRTVFRQKNGIPRQSNLCPHTKATLKIELELIQHAQYTLGIQLNLFQTLISNCLLS